MKKFFKTSLVIFFGAAMVSQLNTGCSKTESKDRGFDISNIDSSVAPGDDFYQYAVGGWIKHNPIPDEYGRWGSFEELIEQNNIVLRKILDDAANLENRSQGSIVQKVGDFYSTGIDSATIEKENYVPIKPLLEEVESISSQSDFNSTIALFHSYGMTPLFNLSASVDSKNSEMMIARLYQSGLGLPDVDYYLNDDTRSKEVREKYLEHISNMFKLIGAASTDAEKYSGSIMSIETRLAKFSNTRLENRDPDKTYNKISVQELIKLAPGFDWKKYFATVGLGELEDVNVSQPKFFTEVGKIVNDIPLEELKIYLKWNLVRNSASYLNDDFVNERFNFNGKFLAGLKTLQPRWKRALQTTSRSLSEAVGQLYVKETFPPEAKERAVKIVKNILATMGERIKKLDWMSDETKRKALVKLDAFGVKIGYPDKWIDYTDLEIKKDSYIQNVFRTNLFDFKRDLAKVGKPVDKSEWWLSPQTVNAGYSPDVNDITFPAAILQPPFFNVNADDAINYGAMGAVIGHEITHGFDDEGRKYDEKGNLKDWWTAEDSKRFEERTKILVNQFDNFSPIDSMKINGALTLGENIADLGGLTISFAAFKKTEQFKNNEPIDGFMPAQRFFLSWTRVWANVIRDQELMLRLKTDVHSPAKYRVIGPFRNMSEFISAFDLKAGDKMFLPENERVKIW